jgi:hypothetical protein
MTPVCEVPTCVVLPGGGAAAGDVLVILAHPTLSVTININMAFFSVIRDLPSSRIARTMPTTIARAVFVLTPAADRWRRVVAVKIPRGDRVGGL